MKKGIQSGRSITTLSKVLLCLTGIFVGLGFAEIVLRLLDYRRPLSSEWILDTPYRIPNDEVISIDPRFLNDSSYKSFESPNPVQLIVTLGDSFTAGFPVDIKDSWPSVLERDLWCHLSNIRIINLGMGDSGPDQQFRFFTKYVLPRIKPGIVIWQFYTNDTTDNLIKSVYEISKNDALVPISAQNHWMVRRQRFYQSLPLPSIVKSKSYLVHLTLQPFERHKEASVPAGWEKHEWARHKIELAIDRMNELSKSYNFKVYYVLVAPQGLYQNHVSTSGPLYWQPLEYEKLHSILKKQPGFIEARFRSGDGGEAENYAVTLFNDGSRDPEPIGFRHFNESGYRLLGKKIAERLLQDLGASESSKMTCQE